MVPDEGVTYWVGGKESGTASVLRELVKEMAGEQQAEDRPAKDMLAAVMKRLEVPVPVSGSATQSDS